MLALRGSKSSILVLTAAILIVSVASYTLFIPYALGIVTAIDLTINTTADHLLAGHRTVVVNDNKIYAFYIDAGTSPCRYVKITNSGNTPSAGVSVGSDCLGISVWYDQWTPNATSGQQYIHIAIINAKDAVYNRLDTTTDTLLGAVSASTSTGQVGLYTNIANSVSITKGTDGYIYIAADDTSDSFVVRCSSTSTSCGSQSDWSEAGSRPQDLANDYSILQPLTNSEIMLINRDISAENIRYKIWNGTSWNTNWTTIDPGAPDNTTNYDVCMDAVTGYDAAQSTTTTYIAYCADVLNLGTDDDIRTARYQNGQLATSTTAGTTTGTFIDNSANGITSVALGLEKNTDNITALMTMRTTPATASTGKLFTATSTDGMNSWTALSAAWGTSTNYFNGDISAVSDERLYATWIESTGDDIWGETLADLTPPSSGGGGGGKQSEFFFGFAIPFLNRRCKKFV